MEQANHHEMMNHNSPTKNSMMMKMYFHFGLGDTILFENCVVNTQVQLMITCFVFLLISVLYEGLRYYRQFVLKKNVKFYQLATISNQMDNETGDVETRDTVNDSEQWKRSNINCLHLYQSLLHVLQVAISYTLMLGFMTFNVWICIAILLGAGLGYYLFFKQKLNCDIITEHCH